MSNIFIDDVGIGFPLVLVHGYLGSSDMWRFQKNFFSKNFRLLRQHYLVLVKVQNLSH